MADNGRGAATFSPTSPSSGVGTLDSQGFPAASPTDEGLPEVVPGSTTTTLKAAHSSSGDDGSQFPEAVRDQHGLESARSGVEKDPKYPVILDGAPKLLATLENINASRNSGDGSLALPWEPSLMFDPRSTEGAGGSENRRICGLRRRTFMLILLGALVVMSAAAVGGGVGGSIVAARNGRTPSPTTTTTLTFTSAPKQTKSSKTTPTPTPTPVYLNNDTHYAVPPLKDGFSFQAFSGYNYTGSASGIVTDEGPSDLPFQAYSYVWDRNGTWCCLNFCETTGGNATTAGNYWCDTRFQPDSSGPFNHIFVWCGVDQNNQTLLSIWQRKCF